MAPQRALLSASAALLLRNSRVMADSSGQALPAVGALSGDSMQSKSIVVEVTHDSSPSRSSNGIDTDGAQVNERAAHTNHASTDRFVNDLREQQAAADMELLAPLGWPSEEPAASSGKNVGRFDCQLLDECDESPGGFNGASYRGCQSKTRSGNTCQKWTEQSPHTHMYSADAYASRGLGLGDHNYCRNPDGGLAIWCYTTNPEERWDYCVPMNKNHVSDEHRNWCCKHESKGCPTTSTKAMVSQTTANASTTATSAVNDLADSTSTATATTTTTVTTLTTTSTSRFSSTSTTTATNLGCSTMCAMKSKPGGGKEIGTCRSHAQNLAYHFFLGEPGSCSKAWNLTLQTCPDCSVCHKQDAGCGVLTYPTTTTGDGPPTPPCKKNCMVGGQTATCAARIKWASDFKYQWSANKCELAHDLVAKDCSFCGGCTPHDAGCFVPTTSTRPEFDCDSEFKDWTNEHRDWCCESKNIGCHRTFQVVKKFALRSSAASAFAPRSWSQIYMGSIIGGIVCGLILAVVGQRRRRPADIERRDLLMDSDEVVCGIQE